MHRQTDAYDSTMCVVSGYVYALRTLFYLQIFTNTVGKAKAMLLKLISSLTKISENNNCRLLFILSFHHSVVSCQFENGAESSNRKQEFLNGFDASVAIINIHLTNNNIKTNVNDAVNNRIDIFRGRK